MKVILSKKNPCSVFFHNKGHIKNMEHPTEDRAKIILGDDLWNEYLLSKVI